MFRNNLELILGPVCAGKSHELMRRLTRYQIVGYDILSFKPKIDTRSSDIRSRTGLSLKCYPIDKLEEVYDFTFIKPQQIIAIDEAQFLDNTYLVTKDLLNKNFKVIISALDCDFNGEPFLDILRLITLSDNVTKLTSICSKCHSEFGIYSQKLRVGGERIEIGGLDLYEPRCYNCFIAGGIKETI